MYGHDKVAFIEQVDDLVIYYHEPTAKFVIIQPFERPVIDERDAQQQVDMLQRAIDRCMELENQRGHGAVQARKLTTIQRLFASPEPDPATFEHDIDEGRGQGALDTRCYVRPGRHLYYQIWYDQTRQQFSLAGSLAASPMPWEQEALHLSEAYQVALQLDQQRKELNLHSAREVRERFHVPFEPDTARVDR